jgi:hypothetical protein
VLRPIHRSRSLAGRAALLVTAVIAAATPAAAQTAGRRVTKDATGAGAPPRPASVAGARAASAGADGALPLKYTPRPTVPAITAGDLMSRLYAFADDSMMGREAGTEANLKGAAFIARELQRLGLRPAGEGGTYFQDVPFVRRTAAGGARLTVEGGVVDTADFVIAMGRGTPRAFEGTAAAVYGGTAAEPALTREQAAGKVVVLRMETLAPLRLSVQSPLAGAAAVVFAGPDRIPPASRELANTAAMAMAARTASATIPPQLFVTRAVAERMLGAPMDGLAPGAAGKSVTGGVRYQEATAPARNVIAILPGSDPALRGQYVALGAHNDHVGYARRAVDHDSLKAANAARRAAYIAIDTGGAEALDRAALQQVAERVRGNAVNVDSLRRLRPARPDSINNGADDDGSGSMALLEIAENLAAARVKPKRSVLFVWHTAEEKGLLGSRWYADHPTVSRDSIVAQLNIDMIGRGRREDVATGGPDYVGIVGARRLSTELGDLAAELARRGGVRLDYALDANGHPQNIYCRSDHYNYARYGIPIAFFFTGLHGDYHQVTDEPQYIDYPHYARITNYVRDLTVRVADLDHRVVVDQPKPDPNGECRQ